MRVWAGSGAVLPTHCQVTGHFLIRVTSQSPTLSPQFLLLMAPVSDGIRWCQVEMFPHRHQPIRGPEAAADQWEAGSGLVITRVTCHASQFVVTLITCHKCHAADTASPDSLTSRHKTIYNEQYRFESLIHSLLESHLTNEENAAAPCSLQHCSTEHAER